MRMAAAALAVLAFAGAAQAKPRAVIAFLPRGPGETRPLLEEFAARGMAIGMTSPTVGGFDPRQMALDMSQGARIPTRLYSKRIGALRLRGGLLSDWGVALRRADKAPGDIEPGLLASAVEAAGGRVGYARTGGPPGASGGGPSLGPIVAADRRGRVRSARPGDALDVVTLPAGAAGLRALDRLLAQPAKFVYVVEEPFGTRLRLLPSGVRAPGMRGQLRSTTTRRNGLIAATDVAPSILRALAIPVPDAMQGEPIEGRGPPDAHAVLRMADRLSVVTSRRVSTLEWIAGAWLVLLAALTLARRSAGRNAGLRVGLLAALWVPGLALVTAGLDPSRSAEGAIVGLGAVALGLVTDRILRWPLAPAVPALVVFVAHAVDLVRGSPLIGASIAGPNPAGGARFYGIGNELEVILSISALIGTGAALSVPRAPRPGRAFAAAAVVAAAIMGAGRLGADVGAVITLGAGGAAAVIAALPAPPSRRVLALGIAAPIAAVAALIVLDLATGGNGHLTRSVVHSHGSGNLADVVRRRFDSSFAGLGKPGQAITFAVAVGAIVWLATRIRVWMRTLPRPFAAGLVGAWFAAVIGALANDSGPLILEIGAVMLVVAHCYAWAQPAPDKGPVV